MQREAEMGVRQSQDKDHQGGQRPPESRRRKYRIPSPSQLASTLTSDFCLQSCEEAHFCCLKPTPQAPLPPPPPFSNSLPHPQETRRGSIVVWRSLMGPLSRMFLKCEYDEMHRIGKKQNKNSCTEVHVSLITEDTPGTLTTGDFHVSETLKNSHLARGGVTCHWRLCMNSAINTARDPQASSPRCSE